MNKYRYLNGNIIKHDYKYMYPNADQIQLLKLHIMITISITLIPGQLFKGCLKYSRWSFNKTYTNNKSNNCAINSNIVNHRNTNVCCKIFIEKLNGIVQQIS